MKTSAWVEWSWVLVVVTLHLPSAEADAVWSVVSGTVEYSDIQSASYAGSCYFTCPGGNAGGGGSCASSPIVGETAANGESLKCDAPGLQNANTRWNCGTAQDGWGTFYDAASTCGANTNGVVLRRSWICPFCTKYVLFCCSAEHDHHSHSPHQHNPHAHTPHTRLR